jgi:ribose transport system ATP-binding protein
LDEPTAALADKEADRIVEVLNELRRSGLSMVYISHRMGEISRVCDSIVALRNGKVVWSGQADAESVRHAIVASINRSGKSEENTIQAGPRKTVDSDIALECLGLTNSRLTDVSLRVSSGEVVGLCGLLGSGRSEILRAISGADSVSSGQICVSGKNVEMKSPSHSVSHGVGLLPEDRRNQGALLGLSVMDNLTLPRIPNRRGFLRPALEKFMSDESIQNFGIRCQNITDLLSTLSGGNQQKVILARWMLAGVKVLLLDEPTAGIDVVAKKELLDAVYKKTDEGLAVVIASSDLDDLVRYCDRIYIVRDGKIVHEIVGQVTAEELTEWCNKRLD